MLASKITFKRYCNRLGWHKNQSKYCQIVTPINRLKCFIYACYCKKYKETYDDVIDGDETLVELRVTNSQNLVKPGSKLLRASGGKNGKPKHSPKIHLFGAISRKGLTPLVIFKGIGNERETSLKKNKIRKPTLYKFVNKLYEEYGPSYIFPASQITINSLAFPKQ